MGKENAEIQGQETAVLFLVRIPRDGAHRITVLRPDHHIVIDGPGLANDDGVQIQIAEGRLRSGDARTVPGTFRRFSGRQACCQGQPQEQQQQYLSLHEYYFRQI